MLERTRGLFIDTSGIGECSEVSDEKAVLPRTAGWISEKWGSRCSLVLEWVCEAHLAVNYCSNVFHHLMAEEGRNMTT